MYRNPTVTLLTSVRSVVRLEMAALGVDLAASRMRALVHSGASGRGGPAKIRVQRSIREIKDQNRLPDARSRTPGGRDLGG